MKAKAVGVILVSTLMAAAVVQGAGPVVGWRTDGTGRYPDADPPITWSADSDNIIWKTPMPGWSNSSPVIVGGRLFVCSEPATLVCVDVRSGKILWSAKNGYEDVLSAGQLARAEGGKKKAEPLEAEARKLGEQIDRLRKSPDAKKPATRREIKALRNRRGKLDKKIRELDVLRKPATHGVNGHSSPTPVTEGTYVYTLSGIGTVACYDVAGRRRWARVLEKPTRGWGHSASPVLVGRKLIVHIQDLVALDTRTGRELWRVKLGANWGSPIAARVGRTDVVISPTDGRIVRVSDGKVLAKKTGGLEFAAPVLHGGVVYFIEKKATAFRLPDAAGESVAPERIWKSSIRGSRHYGSPVIYEGLIYAMSREEFFTVLDAATGEKIYDRKMNVDKDINSAYPSVTLAGNYLFVGFKGGTTIVIAPGRTYEQVARNELEEYRSSPVFIGDRMYLRGMKHLYCIGKGGVAAGR